VVTDGRKGCFREDETPRFGRVSSVGATVAGVSADRKGRKTPSIEKYRPIGILFQETRR
jgi:hypothetical protein